MSCCTHLCVASTRSWHINYTFWSSFWRPLPYWNLLQPASYGLKKKCSKNTCVILMIINKSFDSSILLNSRDKQMTNHLPDWALLLARLCQPKSPLTQIPPSGRSGSFCNTLLTDSSATINAARSLYHQQTSFQLGYNVAGGGHYLKTNSLP